MTHDIRRLPDAELEVMQALWDCDPPASRADIEAILFPKHPMAMTTLLTLLTRLGEKGFLKAEKLGRGKGYYDRYMVRFTGISAGICYSTELKPFLYHGRYDRHVDIVVTDKRIKTCNK